MKLVKGSAEAKAYMAKIRGMKGKGMKGMHTMPDGSIMKDSDMKKKKRTGRFVKGSAEAKAYMASIRKMK
jgi:hypothetical protein